MKLVMSLLVRDGIDLIKENLDFHLSFGVDHIVVTDNGSIDGTREILADYEKVGLVTIIDEPTQDFSQGKWMTRAALFAKEQLAADWVLNNDVDEFWYPHKGDYKKHLQQDNSDLLICHRKNMVFAYDDPSTRPWYEKINYRITHPTEFTPPEDIYGGQIENLYFYLALPYKVLTRTEYLTEINMGNHSARFSKKPVKKTADIEIYHFPVLSNEQFLKKIYQGGLAYKQNTELKETVGWHWRRWYKFLENGQSERILAEALPDKNRLELDINSNIVEVDNTISSHFQKINQ